MLLILDETKMQGVSGLVKYRHEFSKVASQSPASDAPSR